ncbi:DUF309 domain-containing protein [Mesorhizobium sp.]|nr:DUF309 domain-containing protein [Mesorhizobium sp.]
MPPGALAEKLFLPAGAFRSEHPFRMSRVCYTALMAIGAMLRRRWLPEKSFPSYAYLPGRQPHPVRHPAGHSYHSEAMPLAAEASLDSDIFLWGLDLFNHGYYWEAHEAWEDLWQVADRGAPLRTLFKGLILLSAAGVKIREGKHAAAMRHAGRAAALLRRLTNTAEHTFEHALGMSPAALAEHAEAAARIAAALPATALGQPQPVFDFILGPSSGGRPINSQKDKQSSVEDGRNRPGPLGP